jgi:hypothetical protein
MRLAAALTLGLAAAGTVPAAAAADAGHQNRRTHQPDNLPTRTRRSAACQCCLSTKASVARDPIVCWLTPPSRPIQERGRFFAAGRLLLPLRRSYAVRLSVAVGGDRGANRPVAGVGVGENPREALSELASWAPDSSSSVVEDEFDAWLRPAR